VLDTTFFVLHYFSSDPSILDKTREVLRRAKMQGNRGVVPTIVLSEFYAQTAKRIGAPEARRRFYQIANSGLEIAGLDVSVGEQAGILRHKYREKIPWGDCIIAATAIKKDVDLVLSEDPHFHGLSEIKSHSLGEIVL
jgi:predicted nucleic acid-binding protein